VQALILDNFNQLMILLNYCGKVAAEFLVPACSLSTFWRLKPNISTAARHAGKVKLGEPNDTLTINQA
jgi:hypothetical protein